MLDAPLRSLPYVVYAIVRGGYLAVTTFFVLSGFVLARTYAETEWNPRTVLHYSVGRIARVYPVYILSLAVVAPFIAADGMPGKAPLVAVHGFLLQGWMGHLPVSWNTPAWTLSCEMFFYLAFPLAAALLPRSNWTGTLALAASACCFTQVLWHAGVPDRIKPIIHLADFLMGIAAARAYDLLVQSRRAPSGSWLYVSGGSLGAALIAFPRLLPPAVDLNSALRPLNAVLLVGFGLGGGLAARVLSSRAAVFLGKSSYAMYILHVPILWWYLRWSSSASASVYLSIVIGLSMLVYRFIEEPANRYLRTRVQPLRRCP